MFTMNGKENRFYPCPYIYRNKTCEYYTKILKENDGIMRVRIKTLNGSPGNHINGIMKGLFFTARNQPHSVSAFGSRRLFVRTDYIIHSYTNLYFEDFYCNNTKHKVTLVVAEMGTLADEFCRRKMNLLNKWSNPFLVISDSGFYVSNNISIEIFITSDINIRDAQMKGVANFTNVKTMHEKTPYPYLKNSKCHICNL